MSQHEVLNESHISRLASVLRQGLSFGLLTIFCALPVQGTSNRTEVSEPALNPKLVVDTSIEFLDRRKYEQALQSALTLVKAHAPTDQASNMLTWAGPTADLDQLSFFIVLATKDTAMTAAVLKNPSYADMDSFTIARKHGPAGQIFMVLRVDKIFLDEAGKPRPDASARLAVAVARQIFGEIQHILNHELTDYRKQSVEYRVERLRETFLGSVQFLDTLLRSDGVSALPEDLQTALRAQLPLELQSLAAWRKLELPGSPEVKCETLLKVVKPESED